MSYFSGHIGCGNMGGALASALRIKKDGADLLLCDKDASRVSALSEKLTCSVGTSVQVAQECHFIFLGVKPQMMQEMLTEISPILSARRTPYVLVSMAAGLSMQKIRAMIGFDAPLIRIMPNMPVSVGKGIIFTCRTENVSDEDFALFGDALSAAGVLLPLAEDRIDAGSALSGCGPAFAAMAIEALADGAVECGLPRAVALKCAAHTLLGTAELFLSGGQSPSELKDAVCSPGGSTIAGVHALEARGYRDALMSAVTESYRRTKELGK